MKYRRQRLLGLIGGCLISCAPVTPDELQKEASNCPDEMTTGLAARPYFVALNAYYLQEEGARALRQGLPLSPTVEEVFAKASTMGVPVLRSWAFNDSAGKAGDTAIQVGPLQYDELAFRGLDLVLWRASAHRIQLVMPLANYWNDYGGIRQYLVWDGLPDPVEGDPRFFQERRVIEHYKEHLRRLMDRVNYFDGIRYGDHPSVLAWELLNEPRNAGLDREGEQLRSWIDELAGHVKSLSRGKLVGTGEEGFEPSFRKNLQSPHIDFGSVHFFPESWGIPPAAVASAGAHWLYEHARWSKAIGKPLLLGEFGLRNRGSFGLAERRALYAGWLSCARRTGIAASAPWLFAYDARPESWDRHTFYFRDGTRPEDPRNQYPDLIIEAAQR
jgi:mannan endo-1,4-beta-mannosidase